MLQVNPGAILLITLLPASIFMTVNYIGDNSGSPNVKVTNGANNTIQIELGGSENGTINLTTLQPDSAAIPVTSTSDGGKVIQINFKIGQGSSHLTNRTLRKIVGDDDENEIRNSSVVKKSVNLDIPALPTCCDLRVKKIDGETGNRQILSNCDTIDVYTGAKESGVWDVPSNFLLRKEGPKIFR